MMDSRTALRHWGEWSRDKGKWRRTCRSIESRYVLDPERYQWPEDIETANRRLNRYNKLIAEEAELIISFKLPAQEKELLKILYITAPGSLSEEDIARRMGMSPKQFNTICLSAHARFGRIWREAHKEAA